MDKYQLLLFLNILDIFPVKTFTKKKCEPTIKNHHHHLFPEVASLGANQNMVILMYLRELIMS